MSIPDDLTKVKVRIKDRVGKFISKYGFDIGIVFCICASATLGYGLGLIGQKEQGESYITTFTIPQSANAIEPTIPSKSNETPPSLSVETVYASRNGTRYYYENCAGLKRILEKNKISFPNSLEAEKAGYSIAANCTP